ncbi:MAG: TetR/AcrR family transcriptional regulator [Candidatus Bipolaricaulota bacterium]|nr:TetR/AcrR family transcriptional regulator [Candidatus Bipolaricaulota bacterium]
MVANQEEKQDLIRQAAIRAFSRNGFYNTRAEEIAREAGIAVGTIYNYFANKEEILLSIFKTEFDERIQVFHDMLGSDLPITDKIGQILEDHFSRLSDHGDLAALLIQERFNPGPGFRTKLLDLYKEMIARIEHLIQEGIEKNWVRECHPRIIAYAILGVVESLSVYALTYPEEAEQGILADAPDELADLIWKGLHKEGTNETS